MNYKDICAPSQIQYLDWTGKVYSFEYLSPILTMAFLAFIILCVCIIVALAVWQVNTRSWILLNKMPGPKAIPIIGNILLIFPFPSPDKILRMALEIGSRYGSVGRFWFGPKPIVILIDPPDVEVILSSNVHIKKADEYRFFKPWLGDGLLISYGDKWKSHRRMIAPTFHMNILKSFFDVFNKNSRQTVEKLKSEVGKTFDVHDYLSAATVDILMETAMGIKRKNEESGAGFDYAMAVMKMCDIIHQRHYKFWLRFDAIYNLTKFAKQEVQYLNTIHGLTNKVVKKRKEEYIANKKSGDNQKLFDKITQQVEHMEQKDLQMQNRLSNPEVFKGLRDDLDDNDENDIGEKKRLAFLDFMIEASENGNDINDVDIKEEVDTIMFEGHDTTAAGSSFVLCMLGVHQDIQVKVMQELNEIFGKSNRPCTFNDTLNMKYLERVIFETMRMYPPVPLIGRELTEDVRIASNGYILPAGTTVLIVTYKMHRRPEYFPNPDVFDPDNFLPERCQNRHFYSYIPFSAGPRSCVGRKYALLKLKVLISTILRSFKVYSTVDEKDFVLQADIILKRTDGFRIRLEPRA